MVIVLKSDEDPLFAIIKFIYIKNSKVYFIYNKLTSIFVYHQYAYKIIDECETCEILTYDDLSYHRPLSLITKNDTQYVLLRSYL